MSSLPAPVPAPHTKAGLSLFEDQYWYASGISERKAEEVLSKTGQPGAFLVRDCLLPEADYVLSVNSGSEVWHFNIEVDPTNECEFNGYLFTSLPEAITFYTENRLRSVYLVPPERPVVRDVDTPKVAGPVIKAATLATPPPPPTRSTPLQTRLIQKPQQQERREEAPSEHLYSTIPSPPTEPPPASKPPPPPPSPLIQHPQPNYPSSHTPQPPPPSNIPPPVHTSSTLPPPTSPPPPPPTHSSGSAHPPPPPPPPPPRSSQPTTSGTAWEEGTDSGLPSSGGDTSADSNSPERQNANHFVLNTNSSQDQVTVNETSSHSRVGTEEDDVESLYIQPADIVDPTFPEDQIAAHMSSIGQVTGPSDICETRFDAASSFAAPEDDDHSSVQHTMTEKGDMYAVVDKQGVSPPGENRQPSPEQPDKIHEPSEQIKAELASKKRVELQNLPSIEQKKQQLEKQMTEEREGQGKPSRVTAPPGRVVISRVMQGLPTAPYTGQHPALLRKQEAAARERQREREEWERQEMERKAREKEAREREQREREQREREAREREEEERKTREKEEKKKKRFSFIRGLSKKEKEPEVKREHAEPQAAELVTRSLPTSPEHQVPPGVAVVVPISAEQQDELQSKFANIARHKWSDPQSSSHSLPRDTDTHRSGVPPQPQPTEEQLPKRNGCRPNTLERTVPKRPSSNPPSLPGSHHSSMERSSRSRSGSRPDTLERALRPSSRPGSRQGTMERVSPPPPTSQPPPAPTEARSWQNGSRPSRPLVASRSAGHVGLGGGTQMNLLEAVLGVEPALLASPPRDGPSQLPYYKPRSFTTTATFPSSSHYSPQTQPLREETDEGHTHLLGKGMQVAGVYVGGGSRTGNRGVSPTSPQPVSPDSAPMSTKRDSKRKRSMKYK